MRFLHTPLILLLSASVASPVFALPPPQPYAVRIEPISLEPGQTIRVAVLQRGVPLRVQELSSPLELPVPAQEVVAVLVEAQAPGKEVSVSCLVVSPTGKKVVGTSGKGARVQLTAGGPGGPSLTAFSW